MKKYEKPILIYEETICKEAMAASGYADFLNNDHYDNSVNAGELSATGVSRYSIFWK